MVLMRGTVQSDLSCRVRYYDAQGDGSVARLVAATMKGFASTRMMVVAGLESRLQLDVVE